MAVPVQGLPRRARGKLRAALALAALVAAVGWMMGSASAQDDGAEAQQVQQLPQNLFGGDPEPPTESGPPPPVLDPANPDHAKLQRPQDAYTALPNDKRGRPDWAQALREGAIQPRSGVTGGPPLPSLDLDVIMKNTAQMPWVRFPHAAHSAWLACGNCHDVLFEPRAGANPTSMARILQGQSCGVCHGKVAFTAMYTCERCHSLPQPGQKPWW